jgi:hypothetical protein
MSQKLSLAEVRIALDEEDNPTYDELIMMHQYLGSYGGFVEKKMDDSDKSEVIRFMQ